MLKALLVGMVFGMVLLFAIVWFYFAGGHAPVAAADPPMPFERKLAGGQSHDYQIALGAGQYASIVVEQRGIDVVVQLQGTGGLGTSIAEWREGEWHQVTAVWNGDQYSLYVDGQLVSQTVHDGRVDLPSGAKLYIGPNFPEGRPVAHGTSGSVDVHNRPLGPGEVAGNFNAVAGRSTARATP